MPARTWLPHRLGPVRRMVKPIFDLARDARQVFLGAELEPVDAGREAKPGLLTLRELARLERDPLARLIQRALPAQVRKQLPVSKRPRAGRVVRESGLHKPPRLVQEPAPKLPSQPRGDALGQCG